MSTSGVPISTKILLCLLLAYIKLRSKTYGCKTLGGYIRTYALTNEFLAPFCPLGTTISGFMS